MKIASLAIENILHFALFILHFSLDQSDARFSCQPWGDMVPWDGYGCQKTNSANKEKKND